MPGRLTKADASELADLIRRREPELAIEVGPTSHVGWVIDLPGLPAEQVASILAAAEADRRAQAEEILAGTALRLGWQR